MLDALNSKWTEALVKTGVAFPDALVYGEGRRASPPILLVGEAPGAQETLQKRPFVGQAGKNLDRFLQVVQLPREGIYITNLVKMRPTKVGASGRLSNRPPTSGEVQAFLPWLMEECALVAPGLIVTLGNSALRAFLGRDAVVGNLHGQVVRREGGVPLFALYHPAAVIYNRALAGTYQNDLLILRDYVTQMPKA